MASRIEPEGGWGSRLKPFKTPRIKNVDHRQFVKSLPCVVCMAEGREIQADDPMHVRGASLLHGKEGTGGGQTSDDRWVLPGCRPHHDKQHAVGEQGFWRFYGIDPFLLALVLWGLTGQRHQAEEAIREHVRQRPGYRGDLSGLCAQCHCTGS